MSVRAQAFSSCCCRAGMVSASRPSWLSTSLPSCWAWRAMRRVAWASSRRPFSWPSRAILASLFWARCSSTACATTLCRSYSPLRCSGLTRSAIASAPPSFRSNRTTVRFRPMRSLAGDDTCGGLALNRAGALFEISIFMTDPDDLTPESDPRQVGPIRDAALRAAVVACFVMLVVALARGIGDVWLMLWAAIAILAGFLVAKPRRGLGSGVKSPPSKPQRSSLPEAVLAHIPDPVIVVDQRAVVIESNKAAYGLLGGLRTGHPLSFALRSPDVLDGIQEVLRKGEPLKVEYSERVPTERTFEVHIGPLQADAPGTW